MLGWRVLVSMNNPHRLATSGRIPNTLSDTVVYEWSVEGKHLDEVHAWSTRGPKLDDGLTVRVDYLLEILDHNFDITHPTVREWASFARMVINCINGGGVPRKIYPVRDMTE